MKIGESAEDLRKESGGSPEEVRVQYGLKKPKDAWQGKYKRESGRMNYDR